MKYIFILFIFSFFISNFVFGQFDDPNIDRVMLENMESAIINPPELAVITTSDGYDNFNLGVNLAEPHLSSNPLNPLQYFVAYNTNGTYYTLNGFSWSTNNPAFGITNYGDPVTAYDSLGNLFYENMTGSGSITGTRIVKSTNNAQIWLSPVTGNTGNDKNWISRQMVHTRISSMQ